MLTNEKLDIKDIEREIEAETGFEVEFSETIDGVEIEQEEVCTPEQIRKMFQTKTGTSTKQAPEHYNNGISWSLRSMHQCAVQARVPHIFETVKHLIQPHIMEHQRVISVLEYLGKLHRWNREVFHAESLCEGFEACVASEEAYKRLVGEVFRDSYYGVEALAQD